MVLSQLILHGLQYASDDHAEDQAPNTMRRLFALYCVVMAEAAMHSGGTATFTPPSDPQRPLVHFTPPQGWMNDPSKPIEDTRKSALYRYHLYFQVFNSTRPVLPTVTNSRLLSVDAELDQGVVARRMGPILGACGVAEHCGTLEDARVHQHRQAR